MKKRLRKTGEIVDVIAYNNIYRSERECSDSVSYIDSKGVEHPNEKGLNLWRDFEDVEEVLNTDIDWEQVRINASIAALKGFSSNPHNQMVDASIQKLSEWAVKAADALIAELKKGGQHADTK